MALVVDADSRGTGVYGSLGTLPSDPTFALVI
jgi:hypothetical protein